jgi:hypothetical protein
VLTYHSANTNGKQGDESEEEGEESGEDGEDQDEMDTNGMISAYPHSFVPLPSFVLSLFLLCLVYFFSLRFSRRKREKMK